MMDRQDGNRFVGVYSVLITPFDADESIEFDALPALIDHQVRAGVRGVVCFGLASEGYKLLDRERSDVLRVVVEAAGGRVEVIAGTEHRSTEAAAVRAAEAQELGATALMAFPPSFLAPSTQQIVDYYRAIATRSDLPIIVQDAPAWTGVSLPPEVLASIASAVPLANYVKVEAPPTAPKVERLRRDGIEAVGGYGCLHLFEELCRGVVAVMPGCAYPGVYVSILEAFARGDRDEAEQHARRMLPLAVLSMSSLDVFVAVQKRFLHRAGVIGTADLRQPGARLDAQQVELVDRFLSELRPIL